MRSVASILAGISFVIGAPTFLIANERPASGATLFILAIAAFLVFLLAVAAVMIGVLGLARAVRRRDPYRWAAMACILALASLVFSLVVNFASLRAAAWH